MNNIAIVIPTKNRHRFVQRQIYWYMTRSIPVTVYVADSSDVIGPFNRFDIRVVHRVYKGQNKVECIENILSLVEEPFVAECGDDDFLIPEALEQQRLHIKTFGYRWEHPEAAGSCSGNGIVLDERNHNCGPYDQTWMTQFGLHDRHVYADAIAAANRIKGFGASQRASREVVKMLMTKKFGVAHVDRLSVIRCVGHDGNRYTGPAPLMEPEIRAIVGDTRFDEYQNSVIRKPSRLAWALRNPQWPWGPGHREYAELMRFLHTR